MTRTVRVALGGGALAMTTGTVLLFVALTGRSEAFERRAEREAVPPEAPHAAPSARVEAALLHEAISAVGPCTRF